MHRPFDRTRGSETGLSSSEGDEIHLLIVDGDSDNASAMAASLHASSDEQSTIRTRSLQSIADLVSEYLDCYHLVVVSPWATDGTGMDAISYLRNAAPHLPVVMVTPTSSPRLASEAILSGAIDCLVQDDTFLDRLPVLLHKCLAQVRMREETDRLQRRLNSSMGELVQEVNHLQRMISQLENAAITDALTGLNNRRRLDFALEHEWRRRERSGESLAFIMIDVDHFKQVNDQFGHQEGDAILRLVGRVLHENCRRSDLIARYGGDEFCVLMPNISIDDALRCAARVVRAFQQRVGAMGTLGSEAGLSVGVSHTDLSDPEHALALVGHADDAMYAAKRSAAGVMVRHRTGSRPVPLNDHT